MLLLLLLLVVVVMDGADAATVVGTGGCQNVRRTFVPSRFHRLATLIIHHTSSLSFLRFRKSFPP